MTDDKMPELTDAERAVLVDSYIKTKPARDRIEKRRREQGALNSDEARRRRTGDDDHFGS